MRRSILLLLCAALLALGSGQTVLAEDVIKLGVAGAHSGDLASYGLPSLNAAKLVAKKYNAKGGLLGKQVVLLPRTINANPNWLPMLPPS